LKRFSPVSQKLRWSEKVFEMAFINLQEGQELSMTLNLL
jgi:hypothetical protein